MTYITIREAVRLLSVAVGVCCCAVAGIITVRLSLLRSEPGVVGFGSTINRGVETNYAYVVWGRSGTGGGIVAHPEPGDWSSPPREGDTVTVLVGPGGAKNAMLKSSRALWRVCRWAVAFGVIGVVLIVTGLVIIPRRFQSHEIHAAQAA